jgi:hypothetical protein
MDKDATAGAATNNVDYDEATAAEKSARRLLYMSEVNNVKVII